MFVSYSRFGEKECGRGEAEEIPQRLVGSYWCCRPLHLSLAAAVNSVHDDGVAKMSKYRQYEVCMQSR